MTRKQSPKPAVDSLEGRMLLSGAAHHLPRAGVVEILRVRHVGVALNGTVDGTVGASTVSGVGNVAPLGQATLSGGIDLARLQSTKLRPSTAVLDVALGGQSGAVQVRLTAGRNRSIGFNTPEALPFSVLGGSGAYARAIGSGIATVTVGVDGTFHATFHGRAR